MGAAVRQAERHYEFLDFVSTENGRTALEMRRMYGDMKEHGGDGLSRVKDYAAIYRAWINMELETEHGGDGVRGARRLFEDWETTLHRAAAAADADAKRAADVIKDERVADATKDKLSAKVKLAEDVAKCERSDYWCAYVMFEVHHGTAKLARNVAERAVVACPGDELVLAMCAKVQEMAMAVVDEQKRRHRLGLIHGAKKWLGTIFAPTSTPSASRAVSAYHGSGSRGVRAGS